MKVKIHYDLIANLSLRPLFHGRSSKFGRCLLTIPEISPRRAANSPDKSTSEGCSSRKSNLRTPDKVCFDQHFLENFYFTSSACLRVGYKMKIWDSGFGGKLNVVSPCDAAKQAALEL